MLLKRFLAAGLEKSLMPRTFAVASAGAVLAGRWRSFCSIVLDTVMAAVPAKAAARPLPTFCATCLTLTLIACLLVRSQPRRRAPRRRRGLTAARAGGRPRAARS